MVDRDWTGRGTTHSDSKNREAPNKQTRGSKKYKDWIAKDTKRIDKHGNMPFTFIKPPKKTQARRDVMAVCDNCHHVSLVNMYTAGVVCSSCKKYTSVNEDNKFTNENDLVEYLEELESSGDK